MKRGRPSLRNRIKKELKEIIQSYQTPFTISSLRILVSSKLGRKISWNTTKKYVEELVQEGLLEEVKLPHSKKEGKHGLSVYIIKTR